MNKLGSATIIKSASKPVYVMLGVSIVLLLTTLFFTQHHRSYNSDDVSYQVALHNWRPFSGEQLTLGGSNNFVDKLPFITLLENTFPAGRKLLFVESAFLVTVGFSLFYAASVYFLKRLRVPLTFTNLLPFAWLASFGYSFSELFLNPMWRGFELGLSFVTFMLVAMVYSRGHLELLKSTRTKVIGALASVVAGIMVYSDPYYLYFTVGVLVLFSAILFSIKKIGKSQLLFVYGCVALSLIFAQITELITKAAGIRVPASYPTSLVGFEQLPGNLWTGIHSLLVVFGADFFGNKVFGLTTLGALINFCVLGLILYVVYRLCVLAKHTQLTRLSDTQTWTMFFAVVGGAVFIVYVFSTLVNAGTYRYVILLVYSFVLLLAMTLTSLGKMRPIAVGLLLAAIVFNLASSVKGVGGFLQEGNLGSERNAANYQTIQTVEDRGLSKGYANYWQGSINTYLSRDRVAFLPTDCKDGRTSKMHWLIREDDFNRPATRSFFVIDPDVISLPTCSEEQLEVQFGLPVQKVIESNKTILIFNYDISSRM